MKKFFYYLAAFSVCLSAFTSCEKDDDDNDAEKIAKFDGELKSSVISMDGVAEIEYEGTFADIKVPAQGISVEDVYISISGDTIFYSAESVGFESNVTDDATARISGFSVGNSFISLKFDVSTTVEGNKLNMVFTFTTKGENNSNDDSKENEETENEENTDELSIFGTYTGSYVFNNETTEKSLKISEVNADSICIDLGKMKFSDKMPVEPEIKFNAAYSKKEDGTYVIEKQTVVLDEGMGITADIEGYQDGKFFNVAMVANVFNNTYPMTYSGSKY